MKPNSKSVLFKWCLVFYCFLGHLAQDCFKTGDTSYELIPDLDDYMQTVATQSQVTAVSKKKKKVNDCFKVFPVKPLVRLRRVKPLYFGGH